MRFDAVIFDCDGVLVDSEALGLEESAAYLRDHGFEWSAADLVTRFTGYRTDVFARRLTQGYERIHGRVPDSAFFEGLIDIRRSRRHLLQPIRNADRALTQTALPVAVASSSHTEFLEGKLQRTGLYDLAAPHVYSADLVPHGKPEPDIFLYAAEKLGAAPERCLVVEDSVNGVRAGVAAGMTVWGFLGGGHVFDGHGARLEEAGAAATVDDFEAFLAAL